MSKPVIICVDDERIVLNSLKEQLSVKIGDRFNIEIAGGGIEASELCVELLEMGIEIPLVIADYIMPDIRGDELLKRIHAIAPETVKILLTGQATLEGVTNSINYANLYRYISKPWEKEDMSLTVAEALRSYYRDKLLEQKNNELIEINNNLEKMVRERTEELVEAREHLMFAEKMVSLGRLVTGVAHEINTPAGMAVTSASYLEQKTRDISKLYKEGQMTKSDFEKYLNLSTEVTGIILGNLNRAWDIIKSFKQVAVDQSSEQKRKFNVKEYMEQILLSLKPRLKGVKHHINIICKEDMEIVSFPGAISQIVTNMIMNSLMHAYDEGDEGNIALDFSADNGKILFKYSDDGKGIKEEFLNQIFDPFFTTKRAKGGTGLGLNIVYNIVVQKLGGDIKCLSEADKGATFIIEFYVEQE